jgi:hypothetical protein
MRERRIIARTFVAQKRVGGVELMPFEFGFCFIEPLGNFEPALERDMGILSSPTKRIGVLVPPSLCNVSSFLPAPSELECISVG